MKELLAFLDSQQTSGKHFIVIFDDHKRFARLTEMHLRLRREFAERGALIHFLNFKTEDTPEGRFVETMFAAQAQLEREQLGRQSYQKTKARLEKGFWTRRAPRGYKYVSAKGGDKVLVHDEPLASIVREALEGFASGRFGSQTEVRRFLERQPDFPGEKPNGELHRQTVPRMFRQKLYAGYLEAPSWGVSLRKAQHEPLISFATFQKIQERLAQGANVPMRKDLNQDFPLRGAVACSGCGHLLTAAWCQGKCKKYPYYICQQKGCEHYGKTVARDKLEGRFVELLRQLKPSYELFELAKVIFNNLWNARQSHVKEMQQSAKRQIAELDKEIGRYLDLIVEARNASVVKADENRISELETIKFLLAENASEPPTKSKGYSDPIKLSLKFLENPAKVWASGHYGLRRIVLKLAFTGPITHDRNTGLLNTNFSMLFRALGGTDMQKMEWCRLRDSNT